MSKINIKNVRFRLYIKKKGVFLLTLFFPVVVFAQTIAGLLGIVNDIFNFVIPILITLALIYFLWGVGRYVMAQGDESGQTEARGMMIHGIIALFVIVSVWGLVALLNSTFEINAGGGPGGVPRGASF